MNKEQKDQQEQPIKAADVAAILGYHPNSVRAMAKDGKIPCYKILGSTYIFYKSEVLEWLKQFKQNTTLQAA